MRHAAIRDGWIGLREKVRIGLNPLFPNWTSLEPLGGTGGIIAIDLFGDFFFLPHFSLWRFCKQAGIFFSFVPVALLMSWAQGLLLELH